VTEEYLRKWYITFIKVPQHKGFGLYHSLVLTDRQKQCLPQNHDVKSYKLYGNTVKRKKNTQEPIHSIQTVFDI